MWAELPPILVVGRPGEPPPLPRNVRHDSLSSPGQALTKIHAIVNRQPGANMVSEQSLRAFLVINVAYFLGELAT